MNGHVTIATPVSIPRSMPSGLGFYDERTGGLRAGKRYVVGAPRGADASIAALQLAGAGLRVGEVVLVISAEDPEALVLQGERAGLPLARYLLHEQCILLAYDRRFAERAANPALAPGLLRDLQRKTNNRPLHRVVLLDEPVANGATGKMREALDVLDAHVREQYGAAVVHVGEPGGDGRHAELARTAFGACVIEPDPTARGFYGRFRLLKDPALAGGAVSGRLALRPGEGFVEVPADVGAACVVYVGAAPARLQDGLGAGFRVVVQDPDAALALPPACLVVVEADAASPQALALADRIRQVDPAAPLLLLTPRPGRSADRTRLLRHGVDEVVERDVPLAELRERLRRHAARQGLLPPSPPEEPAAHGEAGPVPWGTFTRSTAEIAESMGRDGGEFALVALGLRGEAHADPVAAALARALRSEDRCAVSPDGVLVARLVRVGKAELEPMVARLAARLGGLAEVAGWSAVAFPHDGRDFDELYRGLVRLDRQAAHARRAPEKQPA